MKLQSFVVAAALAIAPLAANAISVDATSNIADGGIYAINSGPYFWDATFTGGDADGSATFTFVNQTGQGTQLSIADGTVQQSMVGQFAGGVTASWASGESATVAASNTSIGGGFSISSYLAAGASDVLTISWAGAQGFKSNIDFAVAAVPLPAGVMLLGTALVGMGAVGARKKKA